MDCKQLDIPIYLNRQPSHSLHGPRALITFIGYLLLWQPIIPPHQPAYQYKHGTVSHAPAPACAIISTPYLIHALASTQTLPDHAKQRQRERERGGKRKRRIPLPSMPLKTNADVVIHYAEAQLPLKSTSTDEPSSSA